MQTQERRSVPRWQINWQAMFKLADKDDLTECYVSDINFKGIRISLKEKLNPDTYVACTIFLSRDFPVELKAWVVWQHSHEGLNTYGLFFTWIKDIDKERIHQFLIKNFPENIIKQEWQGITLKKGGERVDDKRVFERFPARFPLRFLDPKENKEGEAQICDVSAKGVGVLSKEQLKPHSTLEMWLKIPDKGEPLYTRGEVVWSAPGGMNEYRAGINLEKADLMGLSRVLRTLRY